MTQTITVIRGDGIGPEIMEAALHVLDAMDVGLAYEFADAGLVALEQTGELLPAATMDSIRRNRIALKSPLTTPVGEGFSSINVELRKRFDLYANVRPAKSFPNTKSRFASGVDRDEMFEAFSVGLVVGGSIVIPHLRRAVDFLDTLESGDGVAPAAHDHGGNPGAA